MFVSGIYFLELQWRFVYIIISFLFTVCIVFSFIDTFLFLEIYPFTKFIKKTLMATYVTELFHSVVNICFYMANIFLFPLVSFHIQSFFTPSAYIYQLHLLKKIVILLFSVWILTFLTCYNILLPQFFDFFTQWEVTNTKSIFQLQLNATIQFYLNWVNIVYNSFSCTILIFFFLNTLAVFSFQTRTLFFVFKNYRNLISFCLICVLYFFIPPDFVLQIFIILLSFFLCDLIFFLLCFKIQQHKLSW